MGTGPSPERRREGRWLAEAGLALLLLLTTACANMTPGQRIALYCNPLSTGLNLAVLTLGLSMAWFGGAEQMDKTAKLFPAQHCVDAIQDNARQSPPAKAPPPTAAVAPPGPSAARASDD
jgi:hypothetical protein